VPKGSAATEMVAESRGMLLYQDKQHSKDNLAEQLGAEHMMYSWIKSCSKSA
jgi:hypothetical protein